MPEGHFAAERNKFPRMPEIEPAVIENIGTQHEVGLAAGGFGGADLGAVNAAHRDFEEVAAGEIVELLVDGDGFAEDVARPLFLGSLSFGRQAHGVGRWDSIYRNHLGYTHLAKHFDRQWVQYPTVNVGFPIDGHRHTDPGDRDAGVYGG